MSCSKSTHWRHPNDSKDLFGLRSHVSGRPSNSVSHEAFQAPTTSRNVGYRSRSSVTAETTVPRSTKSAFRQLKVSKKESFLSSLHVVSFRNPSGRRESSRLYLPCYAVLPATSRTGFRYFMRRGRNRNKDPFLLTTTRNHLTMIRICASVHDSHNACDPSTTHKTPPKPF